MSKNIFKYWNIQRSTYNTIKFLQNLHYRINRNYEILETLMSLLFFFNILIIIVMEKNSSYIFAFV